jgi:glycosyltransferase involved in cell wall biosynthesis
MRIAILHYSKPPVIGGVERVIGEQAAALRRLGHEVKLWSADESSAFGKLLGDDSSPLQGPFLHPMRPIERHRHILPHWQQDGV